MNLEVRVIRLESDVAPIRSDITGMKAVMARGFHWL
jgi:hypothetical protein